MRFVRWSLGYQLHIQHPPKKSTFVCFKRWEFCGNCNPLLRVEAMRRMGIGKEEMSGYGFRAMARTILDEVRGFRPDYIEHQLAPAVRDSNGCAYNRMAHLPERKKMMQDGSDYLDKLKAG